MTAGLPDNSRVSTATERFIVRCSPNVARKQGVSRPASLSVRQLFGTSSLNYMAKKLCSNLS